MSQSKPTFSIITPTFNSDKFLGRCLLSVFQQSYSDYEHIVVDDGSTDNTVNIVNNFPSGNIVYIKQQHLQRAIARNAGMVNAVGDWIIWLDADDLMLPFYLEMARQVIEKYPKGKAFNWNGILLWNNFGVAVKQTAIVKKGEVFKSGGVMTGSFMFRRELLGKTGLLPDESNPYSFGSVFMDRFPELKSLYAPRLELGNPWGDDFAMWYLLTRIVTPIKIETAPYLVYIRGEQKL